MAVAQQEIDQATSLAQSGNSEAAVALLSQLIQRDASNAAAWLALADIVDDPERAEYCLQKVLSLDPGNAAAQEKLSISKGGSLSVGSVGGFSQGDSVSGEKEDPPALSEAPPAVEGLATDHSEPVPEIHPALSEKPEERIELPLEENIAEIPSGDGAEPEGYQESVEQLEATDPAPEALSGASAADAEEARGSLDSEPQLNAAAAAQTPTGRARVGRTDLILIGLTVLAGVVLCALVSAALI